MERKVNSAGYSKSRRIIMILKEPLPLSPNYANSNCYSANFSVLPTWFEWIVRRKINNVLPSVVRR